VALQARGVASSWHCKLVALQARGASLQRWQAMVQRNFLKKFDSFKSLQSPPRVFLCVKEKEKESEKEKKKKTSKPTLRYITPHLVSLFPALSILVFLIRRSVIAQAPSSNHNTSSNNTRIQKIQKFKAKRNLPFLTLSSKKEFF